MADIQRLLAEFLKMVVASLYRSQFKTSMFVWFHPIQQEYKIGDRQLFLSDCDQLAGKASLRILYELNQTVMPLADKIIQQLHGGKISKTP